MLKTASILPGTYAIGQPNQHGATEVTETYLKPLISPLFRGNSVTGLAVVTRIGGVRGSWKFSAHQDPDVIAVLQGLGRHQIPR